MNVKFTFLNKAYPLVPDLKKHYLMGLALMVWVFGFLWISEPFEIWRFTIRQKIVLLSIYSSLCCISYIISLPYQNRITAINRRWSILNELVFLALATLIALGFMYTTYYYGVDHYNEPYSIAKYFRLIFLPALFIFLPFIIVGRLILGRKFMGLNGFLTTESALMIKGKGRFEFLRVEVDELLYIKSSDNYVEVFFLKDGEVTKKTIRAKITDVAAEYPQLLRTHRSYLVNTKHIREYQTKNRMLVLFQNIGIPVSRQMKNAVLSRLPFATKM